MFKAMFYFYGILLVIIQPINAAGLQTTRFVYNEQRGAASIAVINPEEKPVLVQVYIKDSQQKTLSTKIYPSVFILPEKGRRVVKAYGLNDLLVKDRESLAYIHVVSIPQEKEFHKGTMKFALDVSYKALLRPNSLKNSTLKNTIHNLSIKKKNDGFYLINDSPLHVNFASLTFNEKNYEIDMLTPFSSIYISKVKPDSIKGQYIDDYGTYRDIPNITISNTD